MSNTNIPASPTARGSSPNPGRDVQRAYQGSPHRVSPFPETQIGPQGASNRHGKKRKHRHHKRRRHRRPSFAPATVETPPAGSPSREAEGIPEEGETAAPTDTRRASFYRLGQLGGATLSDTSLDSEALLDHRYESCTDQGPYPNQPMMRTRRESRLAQSSRPEYPPLSSLASPDNRSRPSAARLGVKTSDESEPESDEADDRTPLIRPTSLHNTNFVRYGTDARDIPRPSRRSSVARNLREAGVCPPFREMWSSIWKAPTGLIRLGLLHHRLRFHLSDVGPLLFPLKKTRVYGNATTTEKKSVASLSVLEEWSREEKEERTEGIRAKKISEPVLIGGRLRTRNAPWRREEEEAPYRFTYFNEEFQSTIHSQTISELVQPGQTFKDLFFPEPPELESGDEEEEDEFRPLTLNGTRTNSLSMPGYNGRSDRDSAVADSREVSPNHAPGSSPTQKEKRYGPRPTFWLDVLCPTDAEMRIIAKAFGIHALTAEDIMMQEAREKVELFRHYYFINYRTFEQDVNSENFLEPVNMYVIVFREGLLSFHFSQTPHPANVRRRIRQLKDYLILNSDWISYAIIDDITDVFGPLIHSIEEEVDDIDDTILRMHSDSKDPNDTAPPESAVSGSDMLRRVGECRKKVMGLYRLLGNKADVIKGFAKRCNEQWEVAPKSEIGLYLGDIQDHILTMTGNLTHYETLLSRAHSNYLAQINIRMNERQEQTADVLGKLTVLGTIVLPMNIICGMWGMNVKVPGQDVENLHWFLSITAGLVIFAFVCFYVAKRVYRIV
ncbi:magnesium transporter ALR2 [Coccidioides immitis RMSCC 3703]|uniref:Magnesium transporter ALR2 n=1 Tax=Coccidioides immitis RMSCC 3703 TaxID=454286 RepID=A0A0J8QS45_COCIT|nr:magnesium transporter ALR2 [Coccidioides immitis RMSCC 3703]